MVKEIGFPSRRYSAIAHRHLPVAGSFASRRADRDRYEGLYRLALHDWLAANPDDPHHDEFARRSARRYDHHRRWRRETLGFALDLFARPAE